MKKAAAAYAGKRWLRKGFLVALTVVTVGGTFSTVGAGKAWATPVEKVVQTVAGTGQPGSSKASKAIWSELNRPADIEVMDGNAEEGPHFLIFNDKGNHEVWMTIGNGLNLFGSSDQQATRDYAALKFKTENGTPVMPEDFTYLKDADIGFGLDSLYFTGYAAGETSPNLYRIKDLQSGPPDSTSAVWELEVEPVLDPSLLASAGGGLTNDGSGNLYTYDEASDLGYRIDTQVEPLSIEQPEYIKNLNIGAPDFTVQDIAMYGNQLYVLDSFGSIRVISIPDGNSVPLFLDGLNNPKALTIDPYGNIYVADTGNNRIVRLYESEPNDWKVDQVVGTENQGMGAEGGKPLETDLNSPEGVAVTSDGTLYVSDTGNNRVLQIAAPQAPATAVTGEAGNASVNLSWTGAEGAIYYEVYKHAGTALPSNSRDWEYVGQTAPDLSASPTTLTVTGLTNDQPYFFAVKAKGLRSTSGFAVSPKLTPVGPPPTNPSNPSTGGGTSTPVTPAPTPAPTNTTTINVNVQSSAAANGSVVASLAITRTKGTDGTVKDALQLTPAKVTEIIDLLKPSGSKTAAIVLPDPSDAVSQWDFTVPSAASKLLTDQGIELVVLNPNVRIQVPASSLTGLTDDLYFRLIPVKSTATSAEIQQRALANPEIVAQANGGDIKVVGRPMTIETNLQSRPVTLTLPLPTTSNFTAAQQQKLGVYIEHSDGTKQLVRGKVVTLDDGRKGLEISVNKFSTFTIVSVSKWGGTLNAAPYIMGYPDGTFKPAQGITRSELAAIVGRITGVTEGTASFSDVKNGSWASTVVGPAAASGVMTGYSDGTFKPNAPITRGELASVLAKLLPQSGLEARPPAAGFRDLNGHWASDAVAQLQSQDIVTGYADGSFRPAETVTRAEAVTMINRLIGLDASMALPDAGEWSDVASGYWAHDAIRAASMAR